MSDFPHLVKCIRNGFIKNGYKTPDRHVDVKANHDSSRLGKVCYVESYAEDYRSALEPQQP